ncbi:MAG: hypothetical protein ACFCUE_04000 [Candidatus Bathyarchaeia archaeon]|jgi:hypothetical protein
MKSFKPKTKIFVHLIVALMLASILQATQANTSLDNTEKAIPLLSNVFCFDLSKYDIKLDINVNNSDSNFGDAIQQSTHYTLTSRNGNVSADVNFVGDSLWYCNVRIRGDAIYSQTPSTDLIEQSKRVLQSYRSFVTQNGKSDSYLSEMEALLNQVKELKETSITSENIRLNITMYPTRVSNIPLQFFDWYYTENGVDSSSIRVSFSYTDGVLTSIKDTWKLFSVGSSDSISQAEAESIALSVAKNYTLEFRSENDSVNSEKADLSDVTIKSELSMQQRSDKDSALYPLWAVQFWFNGRPHGNQILGIEVCVWGDTKEVELCQAIVVLGGEDPSQSENSAGNEAFPTSTIALVSAVGIIVALAGVGITVKRKHGKQ